MANFFGLDSLNKIMYKENATKGKMMAYDASFGQKGSGDFDVAYIKIFVYENKGYNGTLVNKFTYKVSE